MIRPILFKRTQSSRFILIEGYSDWKRFGMKWGELSILGKKIMYFNRIFSIYSRASEISQKAEGIETQDFNGNLRVAVIVPLFNWPKFQEWKGYPNLHFRCKYTPSDKICHLKSTGSNVFPPIFTHAFNETTSSDI